jgi:hypothetical protein
MWAIIFSRYYRTPMSSWRRKPTVAPKPAPKPAPLPPVIKGLKRVLLIGINYVNTPYALAGCINDVNDMSAQLRTYFPACKDHRILTDDTVIKPTKKNIMESIQWLVGDLKAGENVVFHYSGHGGLVRDVNGDEVTGYDSCIYPINDGRIEMITDDEIRAALAMKIPAGCKCFVVLDACHSGSAVDLRCMWESPTPSSLVYKEDKKYVKTHGTVMFMSGCRDSQYAADTVGKDGRPCGALTMALLDTWKTYGPAIKFKFILWDVRNFLKKNGYTQIPQLSTGDYMNPNDVFNLGV